MNKIILFIAILFIALVIYSTSKPSNQEIAMTMVTNNDVEVISEYLLEYKRLQGAFPNKNDWFQNLNRVTNVSDYIYPRGSQSYDGVALDPWGNPYNYQHPGKINNGFFDLWSNGADGKVGGVGINKDIGNW